MHRVPEAELMTDEQHVKAYLSADMEDAHSRCIGLLQAHFPNLPAHGQALDIGCGTADITRRFAHAYPDYQIDAVDGSSTMLRYAQQTLEMYQITAQVNLSLVYLPIINTLAAQQYDIVISNSVLHHLAQPEDLWDTIKYTAKANAAVFVMDLIRPESRTQAEFFVEQYAPHEVEAFKADFFNSLLAAYRLEEVQQQLDAAGLSQLNLHEISDRHFVVEGWLA